jgi:hypothetical protein
MCLRPRVMKKHEPSLRSFVSGHDFSRAVKPKTELGFSPCEGSRQGLKPGLLGSRWQD